MTFAFTVHHTKIGAKPCWYQLDGWRDRDAAVRCARNYALDHGGYVCVKDHAGNVIFGTDPLALDRAIEVGRNRHFTEAAP